MSTPILVRKSARAGMEFRACAGHVKIVSVAANGLGELIVPTGSGLSVPCHAFEEFVAAAIQQRDQLRAEGGGK